jgi:hypothetical protein
MDLLRHYCFPWVVSQRLTKNAEGDTLSSNNRGSTRFKFCRKNVWASTKIPTYLRTILQSLKGCSKRRNSHSVWSRHKRKTMLFLNSAIVGTRTQAHISQGLCSLHHYCECFLHVDKPMESLSDKLIEQWGTAKGEHFAYAITGNRTRARFIQGLCSLRHYCTGFLYVDTSFRESHRMALVREAKDDINYF